MNDPALQEPFDYSILDEKTREIILRKTDETRGLMRRTTENIITIGENLLTVQKHLPASTCRTAEAAHVGLTARRWNDCHGPCSS